jgi:pyruvate ferredoxin oxidoreductase delta subunit
LASASIEIVYRGIFQPNLAKLITNTLVMAARGEGRIGTAWGRYSDSPERNGIPAKRFAVVCDTAEELENNLAKYEPKQVDITVCLDDTMFRGIESWAWYGIQQINALTRPGGVLLAPSKKSHQELLRLVARREAPYTLATIPAEANLAGLWVSRDDHTDMRLLGAIAKLVPQLVSIDGLRGAIARRGLAEQKYRGIDAAYAPFQMNGDQGIPVGQTKLQSLNQGYEEVRVTEVGPGMGAEPRVLEFEKPGWTKMRQGIVVDAMKVGTRNPYFKKWSSRTKRPVVNFDTCIKCTLCWLHCPDECFDWTPEGVYDINYESCCGCGVCEAVCPVDRCIVMVDENDFNDLETPYAKWKRGEPLVSPEGAGGLKYVAPAGDVPGGKIELGGKK